MKINYDFPWYLQNSEAFMTMYNGLYAVASNISPLPFLECLNIDELTYFEQLRTLTWIFGLFGSLVSVEDALIYDVNNWSGRPANLLYGITPLKLSNPTLKRWVYYSHSSHGGEGLVLNAGKTYTLSTSLEGATVAFYNYDAPGDTSLPTGTGSVSYTPAYDIKCYFAIVFPTEIPDETTVKLVDGINVDDNYEENYWSGNPVDDLSLLRNYIKAKVQIRNKNLTLQTIKQFFSTCLAHREFDADTDIQVTESTLHFDITVTVNQDILNDMASLYATDPYPFGKPVGISYSINYVQE